MRSSTMVVAGPRETFQTPATGIAVKQRRAVTGVPAAPVGMGFDDAGHVGLFLQAEGILDWQQPALGRWEKKMDEIRMYLDRNTPTKENA